MSAPDPSAEKPAPGRLRQFLLRFLPRDPEAAMTDVFSRLQRELPTPCVMLLGEPQVGKSSTVRALTGDPSARIGLGDGVPVTDAITAYPFPQDGALPLWTFLDTPGVGVLSLAQEQEAFARLLRGEAEWGTPPHVLPRPNLLLACVRADDRELEIIKWIARWSELQATVAPEQPALPLLVVQTCLHRVLHPHPMPYPFGERGDQLPEDLAEDARTALENQRTAILKVRPDAYFCVIDLTDPEDEVGDPMYGAAAVAESVFAILPEAMAHMLRAQKDQFDDAFDPDAQRLIWSYSILAASAGAIPPPFGDIGTLAIALTMLRQLAAQYRQAWEFRTILDLLWSLGSTTLLWLAARYFIRRIPIPILMAPVGAAGAFGLVFSIGQLMAWYYSNIREGNQPTPEDVRRHWEQSQAESKARWQAVLTSMWQKSEE